MLRLKSSQMERPSTFPALHVSGLDSSALIDPSVRAQMITLLHWPLLPSSATSENMDHPSACNAPDGMN